VFLVDSPGDMRAADYTQPQIRHAFYLEHLGGGKVVHATRGAGGQGMGSHGPLPFDPHNYVHAGVPAPSTLSQYKPLLNTTPGDITWSLDQSILCRLDSTRGQQGLLDIACVFVFWPCCPCVCVEKLVPRDHHSEVCDVCEEDLDPQAVGIVSCVSLGAHRCMHQPARVVIYNGKRNQCLFGVFLECFDVSK